MNRLNPTRVLPRSEEATLDKPTKTTASIPSDLYGQLWSLIARERTRGNKLTIQQVLIDSLRTYLAERLKEDAA